MSAEELLPLAERFPFSEWGILLSKSSIGKTRFPSREWLASMQPHALQLQLSGHICGRWVRDICEGHWSICEDMPGILGMFKRLQLNFHSEVHHLNREQFAKGIKVLIAKGELDHQIIFQLDDVNNDILDFAVSQGINAVGLFDRSGGVGILPESWPASKYSYVGYAGGLSPENLQEQLQLIEKQVPDKRNIWIDVETKVRSEDDKLFDLNKCLRFLEVAEPWVV
jgi:hypothetical protein